jgi:cbb3-type cytochrome oxidase maturation protein
VESLFFLVPIGLVFVALALRLLFWAINSGQYDNLDTEAHRILFDDDDHPRPTANAPPARPAEQAPTPDEEQTKSNPL